jgi:hypothetical protein
MSILLAIENLVTAGMSRAPRQCGGGGLRAACLSVKVTDRNWTQQTAGRRSAGARDDSAAVPNQPSLLRLVHELQTAVSGDASAAVIASVAYGVGETASAA